MQMTKTKATTRETATARVSGTKPAADKTVALVASQNDRFRRNIAWPGETDVPEGRVVVTCGIEERGGVCRSLRDGRWLFFA